MTRLRLTPHFTIEEFDCHDGSRVPKAAEGRYRLLCQRVLEPLRERFGPTVVLSGFRDPAYNARIGGARRSAHMDGQGGGLVAVAADVRPARGAVQQWARYADELLAAHYPPGGGLGIYEQGRWVHVDDRSYRARWSGAA